MNKKNLSCIIIFTTLLVISGLSVMVYFILKNKKRIQVELNYNTLKDKHQYLKDLIASKNKTLIDSHEVLDANLLADKFNLPIYIINLKRSKDRRSHVNDQVQLFQYDPFEFFDAIDGQKFVKEQSLLFDVYVNHEHKVKIKLSKTESQRLLYGEIACSASHILAIKKAYDNGMDACVIAEDDVSWLLAPFWKTSLKSISDDGAHANIISLFQTNSNVDTDTEKLFIPFNGWGLQSYIIKRQGMKNILDVVDHGIDKMGYQTIQIPKGLNAVADYLIYDLAGKAYHFAPYSLVYPFNYDIGSTFHDDHTKLHIDSGLSSLLKALKILIQTANHITV